MHASFKTELTELPEELKTLAEKFLNLQVGGEEGDGAAVIEVYFFESGTEVTVVDVPAAEDAPWSLVIALGSARTLNIEGADKPVKLGGGDAILLVAPGDAIKIKIWKKQRLEESSALVVIRGAPQKGASSCSRPCGGE